MGDETVAWTSQQGKYGDYEPPVDGSDVGRYRRSHDFLITHDEAIPSHS